MEKILDEEPTVRQVPGTALDSQLMEGTTCLEHPALGVSLDSRPMEGSSCLEPVEQLILQSSWTASPQNCVIKQKSEWKPVITPAISYTLDSRSMEGITYLERPALGVSLDSGPTEGASCLEPLEQSVTSSSLAARPVEGVVKKVSDLKPVINPVQNINPDGRPMDGITYPEHLAPGVFLDSGLRAGMLKCEPLPSLVHNISVVARPKIRNRTSHWKPVINPVTDINSEDLPTKVFQCPVPLEQSVLRALPELYYEQSYTDVNDDMNTDLPERLAPMLKSLTVFEWSCINSQLLPTLKPGVVNQMDVIFDMDTDPPESSAPMIDSDLSIVNWEDRFYCQPGCCGGDSHEVMKTDSSEPDVWKRIETADLIYTGRTATPSERWSNMNGNSDTDSVAELEYKTWDDACA